MITELPLNLAESCCSAAVSSGPKGGFAATQHFGRFRRKRTLTERRLQKRINEYSA
jgi:hypothetical protein